MNLNVVAACDISPQYCYRDAAAGVTFLERAFGFERRLVVPDERGGILRAELQVGRDFVVLAAANGAPNVRVPREIAGVTTGASYIATDDIEERYAAALAAGAQIVRALAPTEYGSVDFGVRDPEGFMWFFGTYRPLLEGEQARGERKLYAGGMRYERAREALAFLVAAFGFREQFVVAGEGDSIDHAQMVFGNAIAMFGSARVDEFNMRAPRELGGGYTQSLHVRVDDPDSHYERAKAAGARILVQPSTTPLGARGYVAEDSEGYLWNFSTYRPGTAGA